MHDKTETPILRTKTLGIGIAVAAMILMAGCERRPEGGAGQAPFEVQVIELKPANVPISLALVGQLEPFQSVDIRPRVQGFLISKDFVEGGKVSADQTLFQIDPKPFLANLEIAKAKLDQAHAGLARAELDVGRLTPLVESKAAAAKELDDARTEQLQAKANVSLSSANVTKAELDYSYTTIRSPLAGVIGEAGKDVGSLVDAGPGNALATVTQLDPIYVIFRITEREGLLLSKDLQSGAVQLPTDKKLVVSVSMADGSPYPHTGSIDFVQPSIDPQTGTVRLRAVIPNPDAKLVPGLFVNLKLSGLSRQDALAVPQRSVLQSPQGPLVYCLANDDKVIARPVKLGEWTGDQWVVLDGLAPGERVVTDGVLSIRPGTHVKAISSVALPSSQPTSTTSN